MKRKGKFYSQNEKKTLKLLGLKPSPMSGAGWIVKEDGENDLAMVQLKSTDSSSYRLNMLDMKELEYHAMVSNKLPIFLVQFLKQDKIYAIVDILYINELSKCITTGEKVKRILKVEQQEVKKEVVKTSKKAREEFFKERREKFAKKGRR